MKKLIIIFAAVFLAKPVLAYWPNITFDSNGVIQDGDQYVFVYVNGSANLEITGGQIGFVSCRDTSKTTISGGTFRWSYCKNDPRFSDGSLYIGPNVSLFNNAIADILGGDFEWLACSDYGTLSIYSGEVAARAVCSGYGTMNIYDGYVAVECSGHATVNIFGGTFCLTPKAALSIINLYGGAICGSLILFDNMQLHVYGYGFNYDPNGGGPGRPPFTKPGGSLSGCWADGNAFQINFEDFKGEGHSYDRVILHDVRSAPIACIADGNQTIEAQGPFGATVTLDGSCSSDADSTQGTNDDINDFNWYEIDPCDPDNEIYLGSGEIIDCNLPLGEHRIVLEVTDKTGLSDSNEVTIVVQDTTPPNFKLSVTPAILWPPNGKMVRITPTCDVNDMCDESPEVSLVDITMSERGNSDDIRIINGSIYLCANRSGNSKDRTYTLTYEACDESDNCTTQTGTVTVPHDNRKRP